MSKVCGGISQLLINAQNCDVTERAKLLRPRILLHTQTPRWKRVLSGCAGASATTLAMTPLDVTKTRMQVAHNRGLPMLGNAFNVMTHIARTERIRSLYRGLGPSMLQALPSNTVYYAMYDEMHSAMRSHGIGELSPPLAGVICRFFATSLVAPAELLRTRVMAQKPGKKGGTNTKLLKELYRETRHNGVSTLLRGLDATLMRDIPFAALYWTGIEMLRSTHKNESSANTFFHSFCSASGSALFAVCMTQPSDVVKTRRQVAMLSNQSSTHTQSFLHHFNTIRINEGITALFSGLSARAVRVIPACAIMLSSYELGKHLFSVPQ